VIYTIRDSEGTSVLYNFYLPLYNVDSIDSNETRFRFNSGWMSDSEILVSSPPLFILRHPRMAEASGSSPKPTAPADGDSPRSRTSSPSAEAAKVAESADKGKQVARDSSEPADDDDDARSARSDEDGSEATPAPASTASALATNGDWAAIWSAE
jgi:hypothetical protein